MLKEKDDTCSISETVRKIAEPLCQAENMEFVHAERVSDRGKTIVRVYLDKPNGITIDDCVYMNRQIGYLLDVHFDNIGHYNLEISSPGINRPLTKISDFEKFKGKRVSVEIVEPLNGRKKFKGLLQGIYNDDVILNIDQQIVHLRYNLISKARLSATHGE